MGCGGIVVHAVAMGGGQEFAGCLLGAIRRDGGGMGADRIGAAVVPVV